MLKRLIPEICLYLFLCGLATTFELAHNDQEIILNIYSDEEEENVEIE